MIFVIKHVNVMNATKLFYYYCEYLILHKNNVIYLFIFFHESWGGRCVFDLENKKRLRSSLVQLQFFLNHHETWPQNGLMSGD